MKIIIPLAGLGKRLRPHTHTKPKPLIHVAGKPILGHIIDQFLPYKPEEFVFIIGYLGEQIKDYFHAHYDIKATFVEQSQLNGQAGALYLTKEYVNEDAFIVFGDTLFDNREIDFSGLSKIFEDGIIYVKQVDDPRRFGVVITNNDGRVERLIEKPSNPQSNLVGVGIYYIKHMKQLYNAIDLLFAQKSKAPELYLMDALEILISQNMHFTVRHINTWLDCGTRETLLETNKALLLQNIKQDGELHQSVIIEPVYIEKGTKIFNSVVGPYVSVGKDAEISDSRVENSIINPGAKIQKSVLESCIIGDRAYVQLGSSKLDVGDDCHIEK